jgi:hypothetical protein
MAITPLFATLVTKPLLMQRLATCAAAFAETPTTTIPAQQMDEILVMLRELCNGRSFIFPPEIVAHFVALTKQDALRRMSS